MLPKISPNILLHKKTADLSAVFFNLFVATAFAFRTTGAFFLSSAAAGASASAVANFLIGIFHI
jgi:hypothetical protein